MIGWLRNPTFWLHRRGRVGEVEAVRYLRRLGFRILARNFQSPRGEIDLIAERRGAVHFVEVKTRGSDEYGEPAEAVDAAKQSRIRVVAEDYLARFSRQPAVTSFDVIGVHLDSAGRPNEVEWIESAF